MTVAALITPPLYAPTSLPPARAAGLTRTAGRLRTDGKCEACVCEICICGTHHCPPTPRHLAARHGSSEEEKEQLTTHSRAAYPAHPPAAHPQRAPAPRPAMHAGGAWHGRSRYADEYGAKPCSEGAQRPAPPVHSPPLFGVGEPLQTDTEARSRYTRHAVGRPRLHRPVAAFVSAGELLCTASSYTAAYMEHASSDTAAVSCAPQPSLRLGDADERSWSTEHGEYFTRKPLVEARVAAVRPLQSAAFMGEGEGGGVQGGVSESASAYTLRRAAPVVACRPQHANHTDDDGHGRAMASEARAAYGGQAAATPVQVRPLPALHVGGERFDATTTTHSTYTAMPPAAYHASAPPPPAVAGRGEADDRTFDTEHGERYARWGLVERPVPANTPYTSHIDLAAMDGHASAQPRASEAQSRYVEHPYGAAELCAPVTARPLDALPFVGQSTSHAAFVHVAGQARRQPIRTASVMKVEDEDRGWVTESAYHFQRKEVEPCPAGSLEDRWRKGQHGHLYYERRPEETQWKRKASVRSHSNTALW